MKINRKETIKGSLLLTLASLIWGFAFVAQQKGGDALGPYTFNSIRFLLGGLVLLPSVLLSKVKLSHQLLRSGIIIGIALALASNLQQIGITIGHEAGKAGFLTACYIVLVPVAGIFLGKKCPPRIWIAVGITAIGLYLLCINGDFVLKSSDILLLLSAAAFTVQILAVDRFAGSFNALALSSIQFLTCGILTLVPSLIFEIIPNTDAFTSGIMTPDAWGSILFAGLLSTGVAYTLQIVGQKRVAPAIASLLMSLESVFAVLGAWLVLGQSLSGQEIAGCIFIFAAIILANIKGYY